MTGSGTHSEILPSVLTARFVRLFPLSWNTSYYPGLRVEMYGCYRYDVCTFMNIVLSLAALLHIANLCLEEIHCIKLGVIVTARISVITVGRILRSGRK